jgi:hypothetical protein
MAIHNAAYQLNSNLGGTYLDSGPTVPSDGAAGYPAGAIFFKTDGSGSTSLYRNAGSETSADFNRLVDADTTETLTGKTLDSPTITSAAFTGTQTGTLTFTGTEARPVMTVTTSTITLSTSVYSGKTLLFTSGGTGSKHQRIILPFASSLSSGFAVTIINGHTGSGTSWGVSVITAATKLLNNSSRPVKSTTRVSPGMSIRIEKVNHKLWITAKSGGANASIVTSLVWLKA